MSESLLTVVLSEVEESIRRVAAILANTTLHSLYIDPIRCGTVHAYGERLGKALAESAHPDRALSGAEESALRHLRGSYAFRAQADPRVSLCASDSLGGWTVICEEDSLFALSCAPRQVYVKPIPDSWSDALLTIRPQLESALIWPLAEKASPKIKSLGEFASLCPLEADGLPPT